MVLPFFSSKLKSPPSSPEKKSLNNKWERRSSSQSKRSSKYDRDSHPLNLPPEELRRALAAMAEQTPQPMEIDREFTASPTPAPASPAVQNTKPSPPQSANTLPSPPAEPPTIDAEEYKAAGNKFFKIKDYPAAIREYTKAIEADPKNATYYSNRAAALMSANRYIEALEDCKKADELDPGNMKIGLRMGRLYTSLGRPDEALAAFESIKATAKDMQPALNMQRHLKQAEEILKNGQAGSMIIYALNEAERGLGVGVDRPRKWMLMRGEAHLRMGNANAFGEAQNVAMSLLRNNSQDPEALVLRGRALYCQGENEKAIQHFRQALSCDPDFKDAIKYLRMVQKLDRTKEEGNAAFKAGRFSAAIETYSAALEIDPSNKSTNAKLLQNRALCYTRQKNWTAAIADCDKALELDSSYTKARKTRAKALGESGNWEEAARELKAIQEANPSEPGIAKDIRNAELELKKSKRKDYYKILGIQKDATETEIKKAYRKLAIVHHPDKNPDDPDAAERFKEIQEAHETLSDSQKRARYDSGEDLMEPEMGGGGFGSAGIDPEILMQMFGGGMGGARGGGGFSFGGGSPFGGMGGMPGGGGRSRGGQQFPGGFPF